jgi:hypothetical protein
MRNGSVLPSIVDVSPCRADRVDRPRLNLLTSVGGGQPYRLQAQGDFRNTAGSQQWQQLYGRRSASERTNSYDQEVVAKGSAVKMRGLAAFSFAGAIRTLGQLLRRACNFVLDATYTCF